LTWAEDLLYKEHVLEFQDDIIGLIDEPKNMTYLNMQRGLVWKIP